MARSAPYPWQQNLWESWSKHLATEKLPHALLLHGNSGLGIDAFGKQLANAILCLDSNERPCTKCHPCQLLTTGNHPDFQFIEPQKASENIKVDDIRKITSFLQITNHYGRGKVTLITSADMMTQSAANSLLKTLEEPPAESTILLTSLRPSRLLPTIRSRCQTIHFSDPSDEDTIAWLSNQVDTPAEEIKHMLGDTLPTRPLDAYTALYTSAEEGNLQEFSEDCQSLLDGSAELIEVASKWSKRPPQLVYQWLLEMTRKSIFAYHLEQRLEPTISRLYRLYNRQVSHYRSLDAQINPQLKLESALIEFYSIYRK